MMRFAICDDEPLMAREIAERLSEYMEENQIADYRADIFSDGRALLESGGDFDLIFLDVQMKRPDGLETARLLRRQGNRSLLIFVTVLKERVFDAFQVEAHDYLLKPLEARRFRQTMDRAMKRLREERGGVVIRRGTGCEVVLLSQIVYCEVQGRKIYLHRADGAVSDYYGRLGELESRVGRRFFKCHRSYLVNLDYVRGCQGGRVMLPQGETVPVSRLRERELTQALLSYLRERDF